LGNKMVAARMDAASPGKLRQRRELDPAHLVRQE
jgi:hypothetical protein